MYIARMGVRVRVCVSVLSLLALSCAKIHWSPTGGSLIFCRLPEGTGKRGADGARQVGKGGAKKVEKQAP